jgi:hypothetical protein
MQREVDGAGSRRVFFWKTPELRHPRQSFYPMVDNFRLWR